MKVSTVKCNLYIHSHLKRQHHPEFILYNFLKVKTINMRQKYITKTHRQLNASYIKGKIHKKWLHYKKKYFSLYSNIHSSMHEELKPK